MLERFTKKNEESTSHNELIYAERDILWSGGKHINMLEQFEGIYDLNCRAQNNHLWFPL